MCGEEILNLVNKNIRFMLQNKLKYVKDIMIIGLIYKVGMVFDLVSDVRESPIWWKDWIKFWIQWIWFEYCWLYPDDDDDGNNYEKKVH